MKANRLAGACAGLALVVVGSSCSGATTQPSARTTASAPSTVPGPSAGPKWVPIDLAGQYSQPRTVLYDRARDCIWVLSRQPEPSGADMASLIRINVSDRSIVAQPMKLNAEGYDVGVMALDASDRLWMGWGQTLTRFDPDTDAITQWSLPPYSGLARTYSMDGRIESMAIATDGEIWLAAGMLSALFDFNPTSERWDPPIKLSFVPGSWGSTLAAPAPGLITISGAALAGGAVDPKGKPQFAVITTATRSVKTLTLPISSYSAVGSGQVVYANLAMGAVVLYDSIHSTSKAFLGALPADADPATIALGVEGAVWLSFTSPGFSGVARLDLSTGAVTRFPFPSRFDYFEPVPSPRPQCGMPHSCMPIECDPKLVFQCVPVLEFEDPGIQGMAVDAQEDLWMVTEASSTSGPNGDSIFAPVVELQPGP